MEQKRVSFNHKLGITTYDAFWTHAGFKTHSFPQCFEEEE